MKKSFLFIITGVFTLMFVGIICSSFSNRTLAAANTTPTGDDEIHRCDAKNKVCLGSATQKLCNTIQRLTPNATGPYWKTERTGTDEICQIPKAEYSFSIYLGAWIDAYIFNLGLAVGLVLILFAGILYMMSGTDPGKANIAKDIIFTALTGLVLIFLVKIIFTRWLLG